MSKVCLEFVYGLAPLDKLGRGLICTATRSNAEAAYQILAASPQQCTFNQGATLVNGMAFPLTNEKLKVTIKYVHPSPLLSSNLDQNLQA